MVRSVDRALRLLSLVAAAGDARVGELAATLGVHKSTASRLLATLEGHGLLRQDADAGAYRLGYRLIALAGALTEREDLVGVGRPVAEALATDLDETVNLVVLDGAHSVCIDQVLGSSSVTSVNWVGKRTPAHATASGKALLAQLPWPRVQALLPEPLPRLTPRTVGDHDALRRSLARVRDRGWAASVDEQELGLSAVAAPVLLPDGGVIGAVAVSGPSFRLTAEDLPSVGAATAAAAARIARRTS